jgi:hypothetical protein
MLTFSLSHPIFRNTISLLISGLVLYIAGVRSLFVFVAATLLLWVPVSLAVYAYCFRLMPLRLKPWDPRKRPRSLIEVLNEKNATLRLLDKGPK